MQAEIQQLPRRNAVERIAGSPLFWLVLVVFVAGFNIARAVTREIPEPPKVLLSLPEFQLTDQAGKAYGSGDLRGKIWVANFIFTTCPTMCPALSASMQKIKHRVRNMGDAVHLVSFTVDPENDTPEKLAAYGAKYGATPDNWSFLTGKMEDIEGAVVKGFKQPIDPSEPAPGEKNILDITHGARFVLVDAQLGIRGYYDNNDEGVDTLIRDIGLLSAHMVTDRAFGQQRR